MAELIEDQSPCKNCENHLAGIDKSLCLGKCKRLRLYQLGRDWRNEEIYIVPEEVVITPDVEDPITLPSKPKNITSWKKAMPEKKKQADPPQPIKSLIPAEKCLTCGKPKSGKTKILRGLCPQCYNAWYNGNALHPEIGVFQKFKSIKTSVGKELEVAPVVEESVMLPATQETCLLCGKQVNILRRDLCISCYQAWHRGKVLHPEIGKFRKLTEKEREALRWEKLGECRIDGCNKIGSRRGLCDQHYRAWIDGRIEHPEIGKFTRKNKKLKSEESPAVPEKEIHLKAEDDNNMADRSFDLERYPQIAEAIKKLAHSLLLPVNHVVVTLLAEALAKRQNAGGT